MSAVLRPLRKQHWLSGREAIEQTEGQDLPSNGEQEDTTVVITGESVLFTLVEVDYGSIFKLLWQSFLRAHRVEQAGEGLDQFWFPGSGDFGWDGVSTRYLLAGQALDGFCYFRFCRWICKRFVHWDEVLVVLLRLHR